MRPVLKSAICFIVFVLTINSVACKTNHKNTANGQSSNTKSNVVTTTANNKQDEIAKYVELAKKYDKKPGKENEIEALKWWTKAAELGDAKAQYTVGLIYFTGIGAKKDMKTAQHWFLKSAQQGDKDAQFHVGIIYDEFYDDGVKAFEWYNKAAQQGDKDAQLQLGECYANGRGVKKDAKEAFVWYMKSAKQGDGFAQMYVADCYYKGLGTTKDKNKAIEWYEKAAKQEETAELAKLELEGLKNDK